MKHMKRVDFAVGCVIGMLAGFMVVITVDPQAGWFAVVEIIVDVLLFVWFSAISVLGVSRVVRRVRQRRRSQRLR